jgi:hypothetical protein
LAHDKTDSLKDIGREIAEVLKENNPSKVMIIASSDMTHYEPQDVAQKKDSRALEAITALDEDLLSEDVKNLRISMCGLAPVVTMLSAIKKLGAHRAQVVNYQTSAEVTKDTSSVVGYAGVLFF